MVKPSGIATHKNALLNLITSLQLQGPEMQSFDLTTIRACTCGENQGLVPLAEYVQVYGEI